ncbi:MAG TPA: ubiquinol-cytochrome c reductase iron-sulfur subunit [Planctomycetota bacterium]|nr:ubiquinol-cytochrome c reductase iron-sulfur subunit [Planctomycetota bacterium]
MATTESSQRQVPAHNPDRDPSGRPVGPTRRGLLGSLAAGWALFGLGAGAGVVGMVRFLFPNVLFEPPSSFKAGVPGDFGLGVDERFKDTNGTWLVKVLTDPLSGRTGVEGLYALSTTCTHLGCIPNWLAADQKFKCPCHGSGFRMSGMNFEGPAPRPLERYRIVRADDGQVLVDKSQKYQWEKQQWGSPEAYLKA